MSLDENFINIVIIIYGYRLYIFYTLALKLRKLVRSFTKPIKPRVLENEEAFRIN